MAGLSEETKTLNTITRHIALVRKALSTLTRELERRAALHDLSKFNEDEFSGFIQINRVAREYKYGSPEYKASLDAVEPNPIKLHYSRNSHHPEHHPNGAADMGLFDLIEMVCDWKAASETYGQTSFDDSLMISIDRFGLDEKQRYVVQLIADVLR